MGYSLAAIREIISVRDAAKEAAKSTVLTEVKERLEHQERDVAERVRKMREDIKRLEVLRQEIRHDIELCEQRIQELSNKDS
jgi:DNA-binding transcriptional MerR regulator